MTVLSPPLSRVSPESALYEVVDGQIVELPPMSASATVLASLLCWSLLSHVRSRGLGRAATETLFVLRSGSRKRRPDVAYVSYDRWPKSRPCPNDEGWEVVPDLAVEVVSPTNTAEEILAKNREYFEAGVRLIWVIYPAEEQIYVYRSPVDVVVLTRKDHLDGGDVLPGYRLPVATLFEDGEA